MGGGKKKKRLTAPRVPRVSLLCGKDPAKTDLFRQLGPFRGNRREVTSLGTFPPGMAKYQYNIKRGKSLVVAKLGPLFTNFQDLDASTSAT